MIGLGWTQTGPRIDSRLKTSLGIASDQSMYTVYMIYVHYSHNRLGVIIVAFPSRPRSCTGSKSSTPQFAHRSRLLSSYTTRANAGFIPAHPENPQATTETKSSLLPLTLRASSATSFRPRKSITTSSNHMGFMSIAWSSVCCNSSILRKTIGEWLRMLVFV